MNTERGQIVTVRLEAAFAELVEALTEQVRRDARRARPLPDRLLSVEEAARELGIGRTLVYDLIAKGELQSIKVGRRRLVSSSAIAQLGRPR
jgi:excisionase family DNA binding protein